MTLYRKKPVECKAHQWFPHQKLETAHFMELRDQWVIETPGGLRDINPGDYIVTGVEGCEYPVRQDVFDRTYERVPPEKCSGCGHVGKGRSTWVTQTGLLVCRECRRPAVLV
jgi:hypothetical protein